MLLGHIGAAFAVKSVEKDCPLWIYIIAAMLPDIMGAFLLLAGVETRTMYWSHSLIMTIVYSLISASIVFIVYKKQAASLLAAAAVCSHWLLDYISWPLGVIGIHHGIHIFDMTNETGLGLYNSFAGSLVSEILLPAVGVFIYFRKKSRREAAY